MNTGMRDENINSPFIPRKYSENFIKYISGEKKANDKKLSTIVMNLFTIIRVSLVTINKGL